MLPRYTVWWERNASSNQPHTLSDTLYCYLFVIKWVTCVTGSAAVADGQIHYGFTFQQIREVLVWDIHNVYFKVGAGYNIETSEWVTNGVTTVTCASEPDVRLWL